MTTLSSAMAEPPIESAVRAAPAATRPLYWSVRRELWENRSIYVAPVIAAGVILFGFLLGAMNLSHHMKDISALAARHGGALMSVPYSLAAMAIVVTAQIVAVFYCLGALHNERRDRSILFWKSLPVSDLTTVLSKAIIPLVALPAITFLVIAATQSIMLMLNTAVLMLHGLDVAVLWADLPLVRMTLVLIYGLVVIALWYAPVYGWLLLVSAWAKRAPFLWAVLPPLALALVEKIAFDTGNVWSVVSDRLGGAFNHAFSVTEQHGEVIDPLPHIDLATFVSSPGLWVGLVIAAALLAAAVWMRRRREPI